MKLLHIFFAILFLFEFISAPYSFAFPPEKKDKGFRDIHKYCQENLNKDDSIYDTSVKVFSKVSLYKNGISSKYVILMKEDISLCWFAIYKTGSTGVDSKSQEPVFTYYGDYHPKSITSFANGFMIKLFPSIGRRFGYGVFTEINGKLKETAKLDYDFVETPVYKGYGHNPHLFCTELCYDKKFGDKGRVYTDVYKWDANKKVYVKDKTIRYSKQLKFEQRFKLYSKETPVFDPLYRMP